MEPSLDDDEFEVSDWMEEDKLGTEILLDEEVELFDVATMLLLEVGVLFSEAEAGQGRLLSAEAGLLSGGATLSRLL